MYEIKTINTKEELKKIFNFLSQIFYEDAKEYNEHYFTMSERYEEMKKQFYQDNELLMYIENKSKVVAAVTSKLMDLDKKKITIGVMAVSKLERNKGLATKLIKEFEKRCKEKEIRYIDLGARYRACHLYKKLGYKYMLMIQVFDFVTIDDIRNKNKFNFKEVKSYQGETYGFIFFETPNIKEEYVKYFEENIKTAHVQFIFKKEL